MPPKNTSTMGSRATWGDGSGINVVCDLAKRHGPPISTCKIRDDYPFHYVEDLETVPGIIDHHQKQPLNRLNRYFHRGHPPPLNNGHFKRLHGAPLRLQAGRKQRGRFVRAAKSLVPVPVVKELVMRRQFWRTIHVKTLSRSWTEAS